jgi:hypothetical protein
MQATLQEALALTKDVFREAEANPALAGKDNIAWALYGLFHRQISIPYFLHRERIAAGGEVEAKLLPAARFSRLLAGLPPAPARKKRVAPFGKARHLVSLLIPFLFSMASLVWLAVRRRRRTAIWTGDFFDPATRADFRLGKLYDRLDERGLAYVELIRSGTTDFKTLWKNARLRGSPALYYDALVAYLGWLFPKARATSGGRMGLVQEIYAEDLNHIARTVPLFRIIFKAIGVGELVSWEYSERQAGLVHAARGAGIPIIGFMHGAGMESYMAHEFIAEYRGPGPLGPDYFGVWSAWWKDYFDSRSRVYGSIEVSGSLRKGMKAPAPSSAPVPGLARPLRKVLWISEPLAEVDDIAPYLSMVAGRYELGIKKRPSTADSFYNRLLKARPDFKGIPVHDGNIFEAIGQYDLVIGSHSTGVIDASVLGKPFVLVGTRKWGDYFEMRGSPDGNLFFAETPEELPSVIARWEGVDPGPALERVRSRFYGDPNADGCAWVVEKILGCRARGKTDRPLPR